MTRTENRGVPRAPKPAAVVERILSRGGLPLVGSSGARRGGRNGNHCGFWEDTAARGPPAAAPTQDQLVLELEYVDRGTSLWGSGQI